MRDVSGNYTPPAGTTAVADTTIESTKYNNFIADLTTTLNTVLPISMGGTGASNAATAISNLGGEKAKQIIVNYAIDPIVPGSFSSTTSATGSPVNGHAFAGICYATDNAGGLWMEARDVTDSAHTIYARNFSSGVWSSWSVVADTRYVQKIGDTMTGSLVLDKTSAGSGGSAIYGTQGTLARWVLQLGNGVAESGSNVGADFGLSRYNDAGTYVDSPFTITRSTGVTSFGHDVTVNGNLASINGSLRVGGSGGTAAAGTIYFGNTGNGVYLSFDGTSYGLNGGSAVYIGTSVLNVGTGGTAGNLYLGNTGAQLRYDGSNFFFQGGGGLYNYNAAFTTGYGGTTGAVYFGNSASKYLQYDGSKFILNGAPLYVPAGDLWVYGFSGNNNQGVVRFNSTGANYIQWDGVKFFHSNVVTAPYFQTNNGKTVLDDAGIESINGNGYYFLNSNGTNSYLSFGSGWYFGYTISNGDIQWVHGGSSMWILRASDALAYNAINAVGGNGAYLNISDRSVKDNIEDYTAKGLDAVLALKPVRFTRRDLRKPHPEADPQPQKLKPRREIGFIAQDVQKVIPEAVMAVGLPLDESGNYDQTLGMQDTAIIAALVNAVKELSARVKELEAAR